MKKGLVYKIRRKIQVMFYDIFGAKNMSKLYYNIAFNKKLNLKDPQSFNEKLQWLKLNYWPNNQKAILCADKYKVREYIKDKGYNELLNELYYVWDDVNEIVWDDLPGSFVLKCNHGCRYNILCKDKSELDEKQIKKQLDKWMKEDYSKYGAEPHYAKIEKKIICEKYLGDNLVNYNIYCLNGKVVFFSVVSGLGLGEDEKLTYFNADCTIANFKNKKFDVDKTFKITPLFEQMKNIAEDLAKDFSFVRVDLYDVEGKIYLSEMTFTPGSTLIPFSPTDADIELGKMLDISNLT